MRIGVLSLGRPTFDVDFAESKRAAMFRQLDTTGHELIGPRSLLFDEDATRRAIDSLAASSVDQGLILQATFTDASIAVAVAAAFDQPISIWAVPEPRSGGRLRLNSFCGLNLASHALGLKGREFSWLYLDPEADITDRIEKLLSGELRTTPMEPGDVPEPTIEGRAVARAIQGRTIARIGEHPVGFDTCAYDAREINDLAGVDVAELELGDLFDAARSASVEATQNIRAKADQQVFGLDDVDQAELDRSLRLKIGLDDLKARGGYDAFAIRCWPETFTEYGGAVCGPAAIM
ncbi:MAG: hypothetical protein N2B03_09720, partial [Boseongicola sp.]